MKPRSRALLQMLFAWFAALAFAPAHPQTVDELCYAQGARLDDARVRIAWTELPTSADDVRVSYCVVRGDRDAKLAFERDAEIVYIALARARRDTEPRRYTFVVRTAAGRVLRQGPAVLQPVAKRPVSCRVDVCQFFTDPGDRVLSVDVESTQIARRP